jgi:hypothetical protein
LDTVCQLCSALRAAVASPLASALVVTVPAIEEIEKFAKVLSLA